MHRKRIKCLLTLSLCATLTSQNAMLIANAEEVSKILKNDLRNEEVVYGEKATIEEVEITEELTKENIEATSYDSDIQVDPEQNKTYSIDGGLTRSASLDNLETVTLTNPNSIGCGTVTTDNLNVRSGSSTSHEKIGALKLGDTVDITGMDGIKLISKEKKDIYMLHT